MAYELQAQRQLTQTIDGWQGRQAWYCTIAEWDANTFTGPQLGDSWTGSGYDWLRCYSRSPREIGPLDMEVECLFSTRPQGEENVRESWGFAVEVLDTTRSMIWEIAGSVCDVPVSTIHPCTEYTLAYRHAYTNANIQSAIGKVNDRIFRGFAPETMLFEGGEVNISYDKDGGGLDGEICYRWLIRERSHNEVWREARQLMIKGIPQYYQAQDSEKPYYTAEGPEDPVEGDPVYVSGTAGTPGWDKPKNPDTGLYRYESCDFATVLGLPRRDGDDD